MRKVIIIGSPGAGKSTFARKLRDKTGLPLYYLDRIWHKADRTNIPREEFDMRLDEILQTDTWIIDGSYSRTLEIRISACDTVFLFDLPTEACIRGAQARVGTVREEMPWVETEVDDEFLAEIIGFPTNELPKIHELLRRYEPGKNVVVFHSREEADAFLQNDAIKSL